MEYLIHILILINIYVILTISTNLLVGLTNLLSLGQAAFYGIGAYFSVIFLLVLKLTLLPTIILVMVCSAIISLFIAIPILKLSGDYFVLGTLGFQLITYSVLFNWDSVTSGSYGISGIKAPPVLGIFEISGSYAFLLLSIFFVAITVFVFYKFIHSPFGRVLKGIRDDEIAVLSIGRDVTSFKIWVFTISSAFIGLAGFLYATYFTYIDPITFNLEEAILILTAVIIGGTGNITGPIIGAIFIVVVPEIIRSIGLPDNIAGNLRQLIYGIIILILMRFRSQGIAGEFSFNK